MKKMVLWSLEADAQFFSDILLTVSDSKSSYGLAYLLNVF